MIHVDRLTKYYGDFAAVREISFDVPKGQVVGFLGPNGAGKSTTLRMLAGYLTPTSGRASVDGVDVFWNPVVARRKIGYMPESCPLYTEMRVEEYLHFRAGLKGVYGRPRQKRIEYVLKKCWLEDVRRQIVGTLSKGYRQRVGLADALIHDPPVLLLDEPTSGLDPAQIRETRQLVRDLGGQHTVLLSTHILPEVEMTCDHAILIARGRVAANGSLSSLRQQAADERPVLRVVIEGAADAAALSELPGVLGVSAEAVPEGTAVRVEAESLDGLAARVCELSVRSGWRLAEVRPHQRTLEEFFIKQTTAEPPPPPPAPPKPPAAGKGAGPVPLRRQSQSQRQK